MKVLSKSIGAPAFLLFILALNPALAQEHVFTIHFITELPRELNPDLIPSCSLESHEQWIIDPAASSLSKMVETFELPCADNTIDLSPGDKVIRLRNISYEFSFPDLSGQMAKEVQLAFIELIDKRISIPEVYDPPEQMLSVYFHEDWTLDPRQQVFIKKVRALSPVIWQRRQTADGEPVLDPETGLPVFYKQTLERIDLRQP